MIKIGNNIVGQIIKKLTPADEIMIITSGKENLLLIDKKLTLYKIQNNVITQREIVKITGITGNVLNITRAFEGCPLNDNANSNSQTALEFESGDFYSNNLTAKDIELLEEANTYIEAIKGGEMILNSGVETLEVKKDNGDLAKLNVSEIKLNGNAQNTAGGIAKIGNTGLLPENIIPGGSGVLWGSISGNINIQTDLINKFNQKENTSNKSTSIALGTSNALYPTQNAVKTYVDNKFPKRVYISAFNTGVSNGNMLFYTGIPFDAIGVNWGKYKVSITASLWDSGSPGYGIILGDNFSGLGDYMLSQSISSYRNIKVKTMFSSSNPYYTEYVHMHSDGTVRIKMGPSAVHIKYFRLIIEQLW